jgi:hypothetical protein
MLVWILFISLIMGVLVLDLGVKKKILLNKLKHKKKAVRYKFTAFFVFKSEIII